MNGHSRSTSTYAARALAVVCSVSFVSCAQLAGLDDYAGFCERPQARGTLLFTFDSQSESLAGWELDSPTAGSTLDWAQENLGCEGVLRVDGVAGIDGGGALTRTLDESDWLGKSMLGSWLSIETASQHAKAKHVQLQLFDPDGGTIVEKNEPRLATACFEPLGCVLEFPLEGTELKGVASLSIKLFPEDQDSATLYLDDIWVE
jgi:hypothetical protein